VPGSEKAGKARQFTGCIGSALLQTALRPEVSNFILS